MPESLKKTYTVPERNWLLQISRGTWIGQTFLDHGKQMRIVNFSSAYKPVGEKGKVIDILAEEIPE